MRGNEFEKEVQEKMGEFLLQPSAPVWVEVERRIRERKKRRILLFWCCLAGLLLTGLGGWWMMSSEDRPVSTVKTGLGKTSATINNKDLDGDENKISVPAQEKTIQIKENSLPISAGTPIGKDKEQSLKVHSETERVTGPQRAKEQKIQSDKNTGFTGTKAQTGFLTGPGRKKSTITKKYTERAGNSQQPPEPVAGQTTAPGLTNPPKMPVSSTMAKVDTPAVTSVDIAGTKTTLADSARSIPPVQEQTIPSQGNPKARKAKWQTGIVFAFGESKLTSGGLDIFMNKSFDQLQSGTPSGINTGGNFSNQSFADSIPLKGPAFHAGVFAKRITGRKTAFSAGLNLAYYSGKQRVGALVDSVRRIGAPFNTDTRDGFYRSGSNDRYTNRYYFIQVPLLFHWQVNKAKNWPPIEWENGLIPSFLIGSRALVYDRAGRIFFRDRTVYNSFSLVYQTGLTATFAGRTKHPLTAGLYYNYHFSRLQKLNPPDFNYLSSYGVQFRWLMKK